MIHELTDAALSDRLARLEHVRDNCRIPHALPVLDLAIARLQREQLRRWRDRPEEDPDGCQYRHRYDAYGCCLDCGAERDYYDDHGCL
jgi:hypothetical protein